MTGDIEKYGTGFIRIRKKLNELKTAAYKISEVGDFFRVELWDIRSSDVENDPVKEFIDPVKNLESRFKLTKNQILILKVVLKNNKITQKKLSEIVGITRKNILNNMKKLKENGVLKRVGSDKTGYWKILVGQSETNKKK